MGELGFYGGDDGVDVDHPLVAGALRLSQHVFGLHVASDDRRHRGWPVESIRDGAGRARDGGARGRGGAADPGDYYFACVCAYGAGPREWIFWHGCGARAGHWAKHRRRAGGHLGMALHLFYGGAVLPHIDVVGVQICANDFARQCARRS